jgi:endonuclease-3
LQEKYPELLIILTKEGKLFIIIFAFMRKKERFEKVISWFEKNMPIAETELKYTNPYELLVAVILSAQCTDKRVNIITPPFFERFPDPETLAASSIDEIFEYIKSCSYPNNKAKHLSGMANTLVKEFKGIVPSDVIELQKLPGVGRKTANVIASVVFELPALAVDTHVFRVSERIGLTTRSKNPLQTEKELVKYIPEELIPKAHHWLILHGRYICKARKPLCHECGLNDICRYRALLKKK